VSKFFERAIYQQLIDYFDSIFNPYFSAFRPGYGCNTALLKVIEDWKKAVNNLYVAAVLMDLSKTDYFSCVIAQHVLLLDCQETLHYYWYSFSHSIVDYCYP
jgi:hypothetical protein